MKHRKATVVLLGVCMLWLALAGSARGSAFYTEGQADTIEGAENFGATIVHYLVALGLPVLSLGLIAGGLMRLKKDAAQGGAGIVAGGAAGYLNTIVGNLHSDASAAVALASLPAELRWPAFVVSLVLQAACVAALAVYARRRGLCGNGAGAPLTSQ